MRVAQQVWRVGLQGKGLGIGGRGDWGRGRGKGWEMGLG